RSPSRRIRPTPDPPAGWRCRSAPLRAGTGRGRGTFCRGGRSWLLSGGFGDGHLGDVLDVVQVPLSVCVVVVGVSDRPDQNSPHRVQQIHRTLSVPVTHLVSPSSRSSARVRSVRGGAEAIISCTRAC